METDKKCCGTCKYARTDDFGDWMCVNSCSDYCADWIEYAYTCPEWEKRKNAQMDFNNCECIGYTLSLIHI